MDQIYILGDDGKLYLRDVTPSDGLARDIEGKVTDLDGEPLQRVHSEDFPVIFNTKNPEKDFDIPEKVSNTLGDIEADELVWKKVSKGYEGHLPPETEVYTLP
jgi:hypothetical protein